MKALQSAWLFIQDQVLGMKWLHAVIGNGLSNLGLDTASRWGGSVHFFLYDVIKITVLLCFLIFVISIFRVSFRRNAANEFWDGFVEFGQISLLHC